MNIEEIIEDFKKENHVKKCQTKNGAFNQCDLISKVFLEECQKQGFKCQLVRMHNNNGFFPKPHKLWKELHSRLWVHYALEIEGYGIVDFTIRQFESALPFPYVYKSPEDIGFNKWSYEGL